MTPAELTCRELVEFLMAYLDGELSEAERAGFQAHLAECEDCVHYIEGYEAAVRLGRAAFEDPDALVPEDVPEELVEAILAVRRSPP